MIKIGVVGCGYWGPNLIRNFNGLEDVEVAYICDLNEDRLAHLKRTYPMIKSTTNYDDLLRETSLNAICIATPVFTHYLLAKKALEQKKHVLIEKPITSKSEDAIELINLAKKNNLKIMVGHTFEYAPAVRMLKEIINKNELGKIIYISSTRVNLGLFQDDINVVWDLAPHDISIINYLLEDSPVSINANGSANYKKKIEDVAFVAIRYPNDVIAHLHLSWLDPCKIRKLTIVGDKKMAVYDDLNAEEPIKIYDKGVEKQPYYDTFGEFKLLYKFGNTYSPKIENSEPLKIECSHFIDCIKNGKEPKSNGYSGYKVVQVLEAAQISISNDGKAVSISHS
tara:strand:- start:637 stop:1653 length:1017 start_codon:yes stop_codon:yes gene_type:complete